MKTCNKYIVRKDENGGGSNLLKVGGVTPGNLTVQTY